MTIPPLSSEQLEQARNAATAARRHRAAIKAKLRSGEVTLAEVLEVAQSDNVIAHTRVVDILKCLPRVGEKRAAAVMDRLEIAQNRRLRGLGPHQIAGLQAEFENRHKH